MPAPGGSAPRPSRPASGRRHPPGPGALSRCWWTTSEAWPIWSESLGRYSTTTWSRACEMTGVALSRASWSCGAASSTTSWIFGARFASPSWIRGVTVATPSARLWAADFEAFLNLRGSGVDAVLQAGNRPVHSCFDARGCPVLGVLDALLTDGVFKVAGNTVRFLHNYLPINVHVLLLAYVA